jgi:hypothetical protein
MGSIKAAPSGILSLIDEGRCPLKPEIFTQKKETQEERGRDKPIENHLLFCELQGTGKRIPSRPRPWGRRLGIAQEIARALEVIPQAAMVTDRMIAAANPQCGESGDCWPYGRQSTFGGGAGCVIH